MDSRCLRFGVFELDPASGELRRAGVRIRVQDQPLRILHELIKRRGEVVTREELQAAIWGETFVDYDRALNTAIRKLRDALSDSAEAPRFIETIPKRGYRFLAEVSCGGTAAALGDGRAAAVPPQSKRVLFLGLGLGLLLLAALSFFLLKPKAANTLDSLAVLPFVNLTGDERNEYIADGVTESLIADLANVRSLRVISRTSAMQYKGAKKPLPKIAAELGVNGIVEGSVLRFGERARVEVKLIDASRDALLWSDQFERAASELDALQHDVASAIAVQLRARLAQETARPPNAEAHLLTMKGRYWITVKRDGKVGGELLRQAIAKDPTYAAPYAALAESEMFQPEENVSPLEALQRAKALAEKAVALDPDLADGHASLGLVHTFLDRDFVAAEREYRRAIALAPGAFEAHHRYGQLLAAQGRFDEAIAEAKRATELDPFSILAIADYGRTLYFARRYEEAIAVYNRGLALEREPIGLWFRFYALVAANRHDEAMEDIATLMVLSQLHEHVPTLRALYAKEGMRGVMKRWADLDAARFRQRPFVRSTGIAARYAQAGEIDHAFEQLERAYRSHTRDLVYLNVEPQLDPLRSDPRFAAIVRRVGLTTSSSIR